MPKLAYLALIAAAALVTLSGRADAACTCACINGVMQAICQNAIDLKPICPPTVCGIVPPSIAPIQRPRVPPIGTTSCRQAQVYNQATRRYEWRELCN